MLEVSNELRAGLRVFGFAKVASQVMQDQQEYVGDIESVAGAVQSVAMKVAANRKNESVISDGLVSLRRAQEL